MTGQERKVKISELPASVSFTGLWTLGYQEIEGKKTSVKVSLDEIQTAYDNVVAATKKADEAATSATAAASSANTAAGKANTAAGNALPISSTYSCLSPGWMRAVKNAS